MLMENLNDNDIDLRASHRRLQSHLLSLRPETDSLCYPWSLTVGSLTKRKYVYEIWVGTWLGGKAYGSLLSVRLFMFWE